jgi:hypothetical protein
VLCCAVLCCAVLCCAVLCCAVFHNTLSRTHTCPSPQISTPNDKWNSVEGTGKNVKMAFAGALEYSTSDNEDSIDLMVGGGGGGGMG